MPGASANDDRPIERLAVLDSPLPAWVEEELDWTVGITHDPAASGGASPRVRRLLHLGSGLADPPPRAPTMYRPRHAVPRMRARALMAALGRAGSEQVVVTDSPRRPATSAPRMRFHLVGRAFPTPGGRRHRGQIPLPVGAATLIGGAAIASADTLHVHLGGPGAQALVGLALGLAPKRLVVHVADLAGHGLRSGRRPTLPERLFSSAIEQALLRRADLIVVTTDRLAEAVGTLGNGKTLVMPPPALPIPAMIAAPAQVPFPRIEGRRIVSVGPLIRRRQPSALVESLHVQPPDTHLILIGTGPESMPIARRIRELGLTRRVHMIPTATWETVLAHIRHADVVVTAALAGDDVIEAQIAAQVGTPVVASSTEGFPRQISDRIDGRLFDPTDLDELAGTLCEVLTDSAGADELAASAQRRARAHSWDDTASNLLRMTA